jgi:hypothetical protein
MDDEYEIVRPVNICEVINDEQMLDFALSHISEKDSDDVHPIADQIVVVYIMKLWNKEGKKIFTEQEVRDKYGELVTDHVVTKLAKKGLVDVRFDEENGEALYSITKEGRNKINNGH